MDEGQMQTVVPRGDQAYVAADDAVGPARLVVAQGVEGDSLAQSGGATAGFVSSLDVRNWGRASFARPLRCAFEVLAWWQVRRPFSSLFAAPGVWGPVASQGDPPSPADPPTQGSGNIDGTCSLCPA